MTFKLPKSIDFVLDTLIKNGHKAYIVGGCVRDLLCGKMPDDYDITTSATPKQTQSLFKKTINTGLKHGTVTVIADGEMIEVTTFRTESEYKDGRHPSEVEFVTDVKDDLSRRDFTVNAMCYNHCDGLVDCFDGVNDIKTKTLRAVGDPKKRFCEDALRILRLFRFAATLDFTIENNTFNAAIKCAPLLKNISAERIFTEIKKLAVGKAPQIISPLLCTGALKDYCLNQGDLNNITHLPCKSDLRTFALLNLCSSNLQKTVATLKCSNGFKEYCLKMQYLTQNKIKCDKTAIKKALQFAEIDILNDILLYYRDILKIDINQHQKLLDEIINNNEPYKTPQLAISGKDILALGFDGKVVGEKLEFLLNEVIKNPALNHKQKLIDLICN